MTRRRRGGIKRGESNLASNQFPICSPWSGILRGLRSSIEKRRGRVKRGESNLASNQFPMCSPSPEHPERFTELSREERGGRR